VLRFGLARVMARPKVDDLRASSSFSYDATKGILTGGGGNPDLKPFRANAVDLSYEKYFGTKAYVGVAGFYKQMSTYIVEVVNPNYDFSRYVTPSTVMPPGVQPDRRVQAADQRQRRPHLGHRAFGQLPAEHADQLAGRLWRLRQHTPAPAAR
jgi:outer membrane receptor protein involved in Fe transport